MLWLGVLENVLAREHEEIRQVQAIAAAAWWLKASFLVSKSRFLLFIETRSMIYHEPRVCVYERPTRMSRVHRCSYLLFFSAPVHSQTTFAWRDPEASAKPLLLSAAYLSTPSIEVPVSFVHDISLDTTRPRIQGKHQSSSPAPAFSIILWHTKWRCTYSPTKTESV